MTCTICGNDTSNVDFDYLIGDDHLACHLGVWAGHKAMRQKPKKMKIKGWEKISGYTYKGYTIVNPIHNADETMYEATILNLNLPQKPKWELNVLTPKHKWKNDDAFSIIVRDDENRSTINTIDKQRMASISIFRNTFEEMIDKILAMRLTSAVTANSHSYQSGGASSNGIVNHINQSGITIPYSQIVQSIQSMNQTIKNLTKK